MMSEGRRTRAGRPEPRPCPSPHPHRSAQIEFELVGSSYANALVQVAQANNALEAVHSDVDALASVLKDNAVS